MNATTGEHGARDGCGEGMEEPREKIAAHEQTLNETSSEAIDPEALVGVTLGGRYEVKSPLGKGGMGVVYLASQSALNREVVVKVLGRGLSGEGEAMQRFEREALGLSQLTHPNIVTIYDFGRDLEQAYIVMEYVDGEMLGVNVWELCCNGGTSYYTWVTI